MANPIYKIANLYIKTRKYKQPQQAENLKRLLTRL